MLHHSSILEKHIYLPWKSEYIILNFTSVWTSDSWIGEVLVAACNNFTIIIITIIFQMTTLILSPTVGIYAILCVTFVGSVHSSPHLLIFVTLSNFDSLPSFFDLTLLSIHTIQWVSHCIPLLLLPSICPVSVKFSSSLSWFSPWNFNLFAAFLKIFS